MANAISIFLHKGPFARRVRQCIADLAAIGLVGPSIWIDAEDSASCLIGGDTGAPEYNDIARLLNLLPGTPVHVVALNVLGQDGGAGVLTQDEILAQQRRIRNTGVAHVEGSDPANLIVAEVGAQVGPQFPLVHGFRNLLLAPEESESPDIPASTVFTADQSAPEDFALSVACKIAGLCGLWNGAETIPVAGSAGSDTAMRLVRTFYRRVDAQQIQEQLKQRIFDVAELPQVRENPAGQPVHVTVVPNTARLNQDLAAQLMQDHAEAMNPVRHDALEEATETRKAEDVIMELGQLYFLNLVRWPRIFWGNLRADMRHKINSEAQKLLGEGSRIHVGDAPRLPVTPPPGRETAVNAANFDRGQYRPLWEDYIDTALALADADVRDLQPTDKKHTAELLKSSHNAVNTARSAKEIIPGPGSAFTAADLPAGLRAQMTELPLQPYDVKGIRGFEEKLHSSDFRGAHEGVRRFQDWKRRNASSLAASLGDQLTMKEDQLWRKYADARAAYEASLGEENHAGATPNGAGFWRWMGYVVFWSGVFFALLWGIGNWTAKQEVAGVRIFRWRWIENLNNAQNSTIFWMFFIWFLVWLVCWLIQVWLETVAINKTAKARARIRSARQAAELDMVEASKMYVQIQHAYLQFLSISKVYGALLEQPFGTVGHTNTKSPVPVNQMPASVRITEAVPDQQAIDAFVKQIRDNTYRQGWMEERVEAGLRTAFEMVNRSYGDQGGDKHSFLMTQGEDSMELLDLLAKKVSSEEFLSTDRSVSKWEQATARLEDAATGARESLLAKQQIYSGGAPTAARPMPSLGNVKDAGTFNGTFVTSSGWAAGTANNVDAQLTQHTTSRQRGDQVGVSELLVQFGHPGDRSAFVFKGAESQAMDHTGGVQLPGLD